MNVDVRYDIGNGVQLVLINIESCKTAYDLKREILAKHYPHCPHSIDYMLKASLKSKRKSIILDSTHELPLLDDVYYYDMTHYYPREVKGDDRLHVKYNDSEFIFNFSPNASVGNVLYYICDEIFFQTGEVLYPWQLELYEPIDDVVLHPERSLGEYKNISRSFLYFKTIDICKPGPVCDIIANSIYYQSINIGPRLENACAILRPKRESESESISRNCCRCKADGWTYLHPDDRRWYCENCL